MASSCELVPQRTSVVDGEAALVVIEVHVHRGVVSPKPAYALRPAIQLCRVIAAAVFGTAVQAHIAPARRTLYSAWQIRPVGDAQCGVIFGQQPVDRRIQPALVPKLEGMAIGAGQR